MKHFMVTSFVLNLKSVFDEPCVYTLAGVCISASVVTLWVVLEHRRKSKR